MDPDEALRRLVEGNARFAAGAALGANRDPARRRTLLSGQDPWAMVVSCADSRVPPELVFDVGLGELFVVRVAGNLAMPAVIGSLELAVCELGCRLLVVLGHEGCGAVQAALAGGDAHRGAVREIVRLVNQSLTAGEVEGPDAVLAAVHANLHRQVALLKSVPPVLGPRVASGGLRVVGAVYGLSSGLVSFLDDSAGEPASDLTKVARGLTGGSRPGPSPVRPPRRKP